MSVSEARDAMAVYREMCKSLLERDDFQAVGDREFVKRSGFQKLAAAYGVSTRIVSQDFDYSDEGEIVRARVVVRATHPSGRYAEGDGACSAREKRFRRGGEKIDHDLPATAMTRATNRAVSNLVAFGQVSAEEAESTVGGSGPAAAAPPPMPGWAAPMNDIPGVAHNITRVLKAAGVKDTAGKVSAIGQEIFDLCDGTFPFALARLAHLMAAAAENTVPFAEEKQEVTTEYDAVAEATDEVYTDDLDTNNEQEEGDA